MKKLLLVIISIYISLNAFGQISASGQYQTYKTIKNIDILFVFNGIDNNSSLKYTGTYSSINWYKFSDPTTSISNQNENFNIDNAAGYILEVDGVKTSIWVIDYQLYLPVFNSLQVENAPQNQCTQLDLLLDANIQEMEYKSVDGVSYKIDRQFTLSYQSKEWNAASIKWDDKEITDDLILPKNRLTIYTAPLCDTRFKIMGDQFAKDLGLTQVPMIESDIYSAVAVGCHISNSVSLRTEENEDNRPSVATVLTGSGPLDITFISNANVPIAEFYRWEIYKGNNLLYVRNDQDQRFTFNDAGQYKVKLTTSNSYCSFSDSVAVDVSDSEIQVPYAFSPNGDDINDEFRVAYRSLTSFRCWVYNRWGRKVFYWTDPQKGWDGKINGKDASEGAYIYLIEAVGTDKKEYKIKGTVNLLRGKRE